MSRPEAERSPGPPRVLVAEDDPTTLFLLKRTLLRWGFEVHTASDGEVALALCQEHKIRLVITDWEMPGLSGPELCRRLRGGGQEEHTYVLLLTSRKDTESVVAGLEAGADDFISKPFNVMELKARITVGQRTLALEDRLQRQNQRMEELNQRLSRMAFTDPLMQVGNRRGFHDAMDNVHRNVLEHGASYGLVMADLDYFKSYNDTRGHRAGDEVLSAVAKAMRLTLRGGDRLFRYGGEELAAVARTESMAALKGAADRLRQAVLDLGMTHEQNPAGMVTCSFGAVQIGVDGVAADADWGAVVERADQALYRAKAQGRNRVVMWEAGQVTDSAA